MNSRKKFLSWPIHLGSRRWLALLAMVFLAGCSTTTPQPQGLTLGDLLREANIPVEDGGTTYRVVGWSPRGFYPYRFSHWGYPWYSTYGYGYGYASLRGRYVYPYYDLYYPYYGAPPWYASTVRYGATPWYPTGHPLHGAYWDRDHRYPRTPPSGDAADLTTSTEIRDLLYPSDGAGYGAVLAPTPWTLESGASINPRDLALIRDGQERRTGPASLSNQPVVISDPDAIRRLFSNPEIREMLIKDGKWSSKSFQAGGRAPSQSVTRSSSFSAPQQRSGLSSSFGSGTSSRSVSSSRSSGSASKSRPSRPAARPAPKQVR